MKRKAFTLIELIVVMAIVGILVLLAVPKYKEYTKDAELTRIKVNIKELEQASQKYYMSYNAWPRLGDEPYSLDELDSYSERILDKTGSEIELLEGDYYDIDYNLISNYIKPLEDRENYILRNPVGIIFYFDGLNQEGKNRADFNQSDGENHPPLSPEKEIEIDKLIVKGYIPLSSAKELDSIRDNKVSVFGKGTKWEGNYSSGLDKKYIQVRDIDLKSMQNFSPIGTKGSNFTGYYNGGNFAIKNLNINRPEEDIIGLFGRSAGATIENVVLIDINVVGKNYVGGLIGHNNDRSKVINSYVSGKVKGISYIGGLTGENHNRSVVERCYSNINITGDNFIGGLVGRNSSRVLNSYSIGSVHGNRNTGGLAGVAGVSTILGYTEYSYIENCYSASKVLCEEVAGGLVGLKSNDGNIVTKNSYYDKTISGMVDTSKGIGLTTDQMKLQSSFYRWDFINIWEINENSYPTIR